MADYEALEEIANEIVKECMNGEYVCDTGLIGDYGFTADSKEGLIIEDLVNYKLGRLYKKLFKNINPDSEETRYLNSVIKFNKLR